MKIAFVGPRVGGTRDMLRGLALMAGRNYRARGRELKEFRVVVPTRG